MILPFVFPSRASRGFLRSAVYNSVSVFAFAAGTSVGAQSPVGGVVASGKASIGQTAVQTTIQQSSNRAVIDWKGFDVGKSHGVRFNQPGRDAAVLNRIDGANPSIIRGSISANGTVILQNRSGILFAGSAKVDVGSLVATTQSVDAEEFFSSGRLSFSGKGKAGARVHNKGEFTIGETGLAALVGHDVENEGVIVAKSGTVSLASGDHTVIDFTGDGLVQISVEGNKHGGKVTNSGKIDVGNGTVLLSAGGASKAMDGVINTSGIIRANGISSNGGSVRIVGRGEASVNVGGKITANGAKNGGKIEVTGKNLTLQKDAIIRANGGTDGGEIYIGRVKNRSYRARNAEILEIHYGSLITADGSRGKGGTVLAWSEGTTQFDGKITTLGRTKGGFVETSGKLSLGVRGEVNAGAGGEWLLDPRDVRIVNGGTAGPPFTTPDGAGVFEIDADSIVTALNNRNDVTITTNATGQAPFDSGDITVDADISWGVPAGAFPYTGSLRLEALGDIIINGAITTTNADSSTTNLSSFTVDAAGDVYVNAPISSTGVGTIFLNAQRDIFVSANLSATGTGNIEISTQRDFTLDGSAGPVRIGGAASSADIRIFGNGNININGGAGNASVVTGSGGSIRINSPVINVNSGASKGQIRALDGASLTLISDRQNWDGLVASGTSGSATGGDVDLSGTITVTSSPVFNLGTGATFKLNDIGYYFGSVNAITSSVPFKIATQGSTSLVDLAGDVSGSALTIEAGGDLILHSTAQITGTGTGDTLVIAIGEQFDNRRGVDALRATNANGRWLLYLNNFSDLLGTEPGVRSPDTDPNYRDYDVYNRTYAGSPPANMGAFDGNRIVYAEQPDLEITVQPLSKVYGTVGTPIIAMTGLRAGDSAATALRGGNANIASAGIAEDADVGVYASVPNAIASIQGYNIVRQFDSTVTVTPAPLSIIADDINRTYGSGSPAFTASYEYLVAGDQPSDLSGTLSFATSATAASPVGTYAVTPQGLSSGNYTITFVGGTLTIDRAHLTITADDLSKVYGDPNPTLTASYSGFVNGDDQSVVRNVNLGSDAKLNSPVGTYDNYVQAGAVADNYVITLVDGTTTVTPALLTVTADDLSRVYGDGNPNFTVSYGPFVGSDTQSDLNGTLGFDTAATSASSVGKYAITPKGLSSANYNITFVDGALTITPAALTITANDASRTYGASDPTFSSTVTGLVNGDGEGVVSGYSVSTDATKSSPAGKYATQISGTPSALNYTITVQDGTYTIDPAELAVIANVAHKKQGEANPPFTAHYEGFVLGEDANVLGGSLAFATTAHLDSPSGIYLITPSGLIATNYSISFVDGHLLVSPLLTITGFNGHIRAPLFEVGRPPLTPGDAAFHSTQANFAPALEDPYSLDYSLGEIDLNSPADVSNSQKSRCRGVVNTGVSCGGFPTFETFWNTSSIRNGN